MHTILLPELDSLLPLTTEQALFQFWTAACRHARTNPAERRALARYVFAATVAHRVSIPTYDAALDDICYEFGALQAPGMPEDPAIDPVAYETSLWARLEKIVAAKRARR